MTTLLKRISIGGYFVLLVLGAVYVVAAVRHSDSMIGQRDSGEGAACTMEAKLCPDGSAVGRIGPSCEFAKCPGEVADASWKTFSDAQQGVSFRYPEHLPTTFISAQVWPPMIAVTSQKFFCQERGLEIIMGSTVEQRIIHGRTYCVTTESEGAAGSIYTTYTYATIYGAKLTTLHFTLRFIQCMNYDEPNRTQCLAEQTAFSPDAFADSLMKTLTLTPLY